MTILHTVILTAFHLEHHYLVALNEWVNHLSDNLCAFHCRRADCYGTVVVDEQHTGKVQVKVTQRINPDALYMPSHYGCSSKEEKTAYGVGLRQMDYVPFRIEPGYGGICSQEAVVTVKKVGA